MNYFFSGLFFIVITNFGMDLSDSNSSDEKTLLSVSGQTSYKSIDSTRNLTVADVSDYDDQVSISPQETAEKICNTFFDISPLPTDLRNLFEHKDQESYEQETRLYVSTQLTINQELLQKINKKMDTGKALFGIATKKIFFEKEAELQNEIKKLSVRNKIIGWGCAGSHCVSIFFAALISVGATFGVLTMQGTLE